MAGVMVKFWLAFISAVSAMSRYPRVCRYARGAVVTVIDLTVRVSLVMFVIAAIEEYFLSGVIVPGAMVRDLLRRARFQPKVFAIMVFVNAAKAS